MDNYHLSKKIPKENELLEDYSTLLAQLLYNRKITTKKEAISFLYPEWENNYDPFLLQDMEKSIKRFKKAIEEGEKITIYADYDADGIPGAVILSDLFEKIHYQNYTVYLPHRHNEGYGIHQKALEKIKKEGSSLIISIDVGIMDHEAVDWCKKNEIDIIITDHHTPLKDDFNKEKLPNAFSVINPKRDGNTYPDKMLCGAGVIFKFVQAFVRKYQKEYNISPHWEKWSLDMLGIATISDMVPLRNENRIFAYFGMKVIKEIANYNNNRRIGLKKLLTKLFIDKNYLTEENISFGITPHINAASRMGHPKEALDIFTTKDELSSESAINTLIAHNKERKKITKKSTEEAIQLVSQKKIEEVIVVGNKNWKAGVLGLIAAKLVEKYQLPAFVWSEENGIIKGSCRSLDQIHLVEIMQGSAKKTFQNFGGHAMAGGFSCDKKEIDKLEGRLQKSIKKYKEKNKHLTKDIKNIDMELSIEAITLHNYEEIRKLAPFGVGNEKPLFLFKEVCIEKINHFGKDKNHLEIFFKNKIGKTLKGISFFKTKKDFPQLKEKSIVHLIAYIEYSVFMGKHELRLSVIEII